MSHTPTEVTFDLWLHEQYVVFVVRMKRGRVTGICGPLSLDAAGKCNPTELVYDGRRETLLQVCTRAEQFRLIETWQREMWVSPRTNRRLRKQYAEPVVFGLELLNQQSSH